jgi:hypothetical protein
MSKYGPTGDPNEKLQNLLCALSKSCAELTALVKKGPVDGHTEAEEKRCDELMFNIVNCISEIVNAAKEEGIKPVDPSGKGINIANFTQFFKNLSPAYQAGKAGKAFLEQSGLKPLLEAMANQHGTVSD